MKLVWAFLIGFCIKSLSDLYQNTLNVMEKKNRKVSWQTQHGIYVQKFSWSFSFLNFIPFCFGAELVSCLTHFAEKQIALNCKIYWNLQCWNGSKNIAIISWCPNGFSWFFTKIRFLNFNVLSSSVIFALNFSIVSNLLSKYLNFSHSSSRCMNPDLKL